jgi:hypothetical protein
LPKTSAEFFDPNPMQFANACRTGNAAWGARNVVEIAFRIGPLEIQCRRDDVLFQREQYRANPGRSTRALRMTNHGFCRTQRNAAGAFFEAMLDGTSFDAIVEIGGCPMKIDVINVVDGESGIFDCE